MSETPVQTKRLIEILVLALIASVIVFFFINPKSEDSYKRQELHSAAKLVQYHLYEERKTKTIELTEKFTPPEMLKELDNALINNQVELSSQFENGTNGYALEISSQVILGEPSTEILDPDRAEAASKQRLAQP